MAEGTSNVIDFTARRDSAAPRPLRELEAYWELLRDGRLVPDRSEVDPRGFPGALSQTFLLERIAPGLARIRVTGRHLSDLMGIDMQGLPLTSLFLPEARPTIIEILSAVFEEPAVAACDAVEPRRHRAPETGGAAPDPALAGRSGRRDAGRGMPRRRRVPSAGRPGASRWTSSSARR